MVKLFPAGPLGIGYLNALHGPFGGTAFLPTGGIRHDEVGEWLEAGATAVGLGSDLVPALPAASDLERIAERAAVVVEQVAGGAPMIVDAHAHVFRRADELPRSVDELAPAEREARVEDLLARMAEARVERAVLVPLASEDDYVAEVLREHPRSLRGRGGRRRGHPGARARAGSRGRAAAAPRAVSLPRPADPVARRPGRPAGREPDAARAAAHGGDAGWCCGRISPAISSRCWSSCRRPCPTSRWCSTTSASARTGCASTATGGPGSRTRSRPAASIRSSGWPAILRRA